MRRVRPESWWPESWWLSYYYDCQEIYGERRNLGYVYAYEERRSFILETIAAIAPKGSSVLDIAAAQGNFSLTLAERGYDVSWNDIREDLVDYVKLKYERGTLHFKPGNILEHEVGDTFDVVVIGEIIEHVAHPDDFFVKVTRLVKSGGYVVMTTPNGEYFRNRLPKFSSCEDPGIFEKIQFQPNSEGHIFLLHEDEIRRFARRSRLSIEFIRTFINFLTAGHLKTGRLLPFIPKKVVDLVERSTRCFPWSVRKKIHTSTGVLFRKDAPA